MMAAPSQPGVRQPIPGVCYPDPARLAQYVAHGELRETTLLEQLCGSFARYADRPALQLEGRALSYRALDELTDRLAAAFLGLGLQPLDRVLFQSANSPALIYAVLACLKAGLIPVCTLPAHREREIGYLGRHTDARAHIVEGNDPKFDLVAFAGRMKAELPMMRHIIALEGPSGNGVHGLEGLLASAPDAKAAKAQLRGLDRDPFQVAIFQLSGGTTGVPKVIPRFQNDYLLNAQLTADVLGLGPNDINFMPMPIMHNACMICCLLPTLLVGASYALANDMTPESWARLFARVRPTFLFLIRPLLPRLEASLDIMPDALRSVRGFWSADAAQLIRARYGKPAQAMFGMSEGLNMYCRIGDPEEVLDWTIGSPLSVLDEVRLVEPGTEHDVADGEIGELICRGPYTLSGYYNAPERNRDGFTSDGFYRTGDLMVRRIIAGKAYYAFAGRTKDVVDRGREKINCEEVETAVSTFASVAGCAVVGMPDPVLGERVCAYVVLRTGMAAPDVADLSAHLQALGLAKFKWPERVEVIAQLPLTKVGKLDKARLREDIALKIGGATETASKEARS